MRRFLAIFKKEFRQVSRDPLSLLMLIFVPSFLLILYGYALSFDVKHIRVAVLDRSATRESRELQDSLFQNVYFEKAGTLATEAEADDLLLRGHARAVLIIPRDYADSLARGDVASVQVLVDGGDANTAQATVGYFEALIARMSRKVRMEALSKMGIRPAIPLVMPEQRVWFNPELISAKFLIPGIIGMLLMLSAVIATSMSIVREKERRTMEQIMVSPVKPIELIAGKVAPYILIGLATMTLILFLGRIVFGVAIQGSLLLLFLATLIFLVSALSMGILISTTTNSLQVAFQLAFIATVLPSIILSGLIFPIKNMPLPIQAVTVFVVPRYFVAVLRGIILKDAPLSALWPNLVAMLALGALFASVAIRKTRKNAG